MKPILRVLGCLAGVVLVTSCGDGEDTSDVGPVPSLEVGDCISDITPFIDSGAIDGLEVVPCSGQHEAEVYGTDEVDGSAYPDRDAVKQQMMSTCDAEYEAYPGASESELPQVSFIPDEDEWDRGIRTIVCFLESPEGRSGSDST